MPKRLTVQVPTEQHKQFKALCAREGATMSEIVLEMIEHWIEDMEKAHRPTNYYSDVGASANGPVPSYKEWLLSQPIEIDTR